eukprot:PhF_6_TR28303/c0_g1_i1/m.41918
MLALNSPGAYIADTVVLALLVFAVSCYVLYYYVKNNWRTIERWVLVWILGSIWVCLVPPAFLLIDVDAAVHGVPILWMKALWMSVFWATQVLAWIVLPVIQEYVGSGEFTPWRKVFDSLSINTKTYIAMGVVSVVLLVYVWFVKGLDNIMQLMNLCIAAANAFGLFLIIVFLSYGMATIPKRIWRNGDLKSMLEFEYWQCPSLHDDLETSRIEWSEYSAAVRSMNKKLKDQYSKCEAEDDPVLQQYLERILERVDEFERSNTKMHQVSASSISASAVKELEIDFSNSKRSVRKSLVALHAKVKHLTHEITRLECQWEEKQKHCMTAEDLIQQSTLAHLATVSKFRSWATALYWRLLRKLLFRGAALFLVGVSLIVAWSEFTLPFSADELGDTNLSVISFMMDLRGTEIGWCTFILTYMAVSTYWAVFQFRLFHYYQLTPHHSDPASLCFTAVFLTRLIMPLCYNFLNIAHMIGGKSQVTYSKVFGDMDVIDFLGPWFNRFIPMFVFVLYACMITNLLGRVLSLCGITTYDVRPMEDDKVSEGKDLVARERRLREGDVFTSRPTAQPTKVKGNATLDEFMERDASSPKKRDKQTFSLGVPPPTSTPGAKSPKAKGNHVY